MLRREREGLKSLMSEIVIQKTRHGKTTEARDFVGKERSLETKSRT